jgi:hypothetical protein
VSRCALWRTRSANRPATTAVCRRARGIDGLTHPRTVGIHDIDVPVTVPIGAEGQSGAVWRPGGVEVGACVTVDLRQSRVVEVDQVDVTGGR